MAEEEVQTQDQEDPVSEEEEIHSFFIQTVSFSHEKGQSFNQLNIILCQPNQQIQQQPVQVPIHHQQMYKAKLKKMQHLKWVMQT